jgi:two-component system sensor histidine kinase DctS
MQDDKEIPTRAPHPLPPRLRPPPSWYWSLPYAAVALFIATMAALLWLTHRQDAEEQRATLINDVLWMEQNLSFQFERNNALLTQLGPELLAKQPPGPPPRPASSAPSTRRAA